jgi:uncharacterized damage-inducible protein DinB
MNKETLLAQLEQSTERLLNTLSQFTPETFNQQRSEGEWSPSQIAEHLLKVDVTTNKALKSETVATNRPPDQKIALIRGAMEDNTKRVSPERVHPSGEHWKPDAIMEQLKKQRKIMREAIASSDMTEACTSFKHPALGTLTKLEWVWFNIYHAERHIRQMVRFLEKTMIDDTSGES